MADPDETLDLDDRVLCPDGACIGVIGPDGRCSECGREGDRPVAKVRSVEVADERDEHAEDGEPDGDEADDEVAAAGGAFEDDERELCPDGACIGVIGPDGKCRECGRPHA